MTVELSERAAQRLLREFENLKNQVRNLLRQPPGRFKANRRRMYLGKTDASHAKGASGTISIWAGTTKGSETDTGENLTGVYNRFADIAITKWVHVEWINGGWELSAGEC